MTSLIGTHEIPCLDDNDYAAYALYMKCVAERVEDHLTANLAAVESVLERPIRVWHYSFTLNTGQGSTELPDGVDFTLSYPATFSDTETSTLNLRGWWRVGALFRCVSNTPVVNNDRIMSLAIFPPNTPSSIRTMDSGAWALKLQDITWETNNAQGESLYVTGEVYNPGDPAVALGDIGMQFEIAFSVESNGVETVTFTGTSWAIYLGDTPSIEI
jgi:hypothetical protein